MLTVWDPIGVKDEPRAQDEHDVYIGGVFGLLAKNSSDKELSAHLGKIIEERISVHPRRGVPEETVKELQKIRRG